MVSNADKAAWDKFYAAEAVAAAKEQAAAASRAAARAAARAASASAAAAEAGGGASMQQQQQPEASQQEDAEQPEQAEELQPPSLPQQVFWTDGKSGGFVRHWGVGFCTRVWCATSGVPQASASQLQPASARRGPDASDAPTQPPKLHLPNLPEQRGVGDQPLSVINHCHDSG